MVVLVLIVVLYVDTEQEQRTTAATIKRRILVCLVIVAVLPFQLLKGNRASAGLVAALVAMYLTARTPVKSGGFSIGPRGRRAVAALILPVSFVAFAAVGVLRSSIHETGFHAQATISGIEGFAAHGTWEAIFATNLAAASDASSGRNMRLGGQTYVDYVRSLPPGPVAKAIGFQRPLNEMRGPAWWSRGVSIGGVDVVVVPFRNFGIAGVIIEMGLIGIFLAHVEFGAHSYGRFGRALYGTVILSSLFWFWYGDLYVVRAFMGVAILWPAYRFMVRPGSAHPSGETHAASI